MAGIFKITGRKATVLFFILLFSVSYAQTQYIPADINSTGDRSWRRMGIMNGNLISTVYFNTGQVSKDKTFPQLEWPTGSGHIYMDTVVPFVAAEAKDVAGRTIHPLEVNYEFSIDVSPDGLTEWGWQPLPDYLNVSQSEPAISHKPQTWPQAWPDHPDWVGVWNGFFGKGIKNADQESYYVVDDDADEEFLYYPDSTNHDRRGIGMRMSVRGLQWSHVLAEDAIFWIFNVRNVGTHDYAKTLFGMFIDSKNGGNDNDNGFYDTKLDLTYIWDQLGVGTWGGPTGWIGYGYLESPGQSTDGIDNDEDGLVDESRESGPGSFGTGPIGNYGPPKAHWSGDEDGDWNAEIDDVGKDGLGKLDPGYTAPDDGEGDGIPTAGEPNFDQTDLDESDQIGLESVSLHRWGDFPLDQDELIWDYLAAKNKDNVQNFSNVGVLYSSGPFPLNASQVENFSIALLMGENFDDLVRNKEIVQRIFNANYRFAKPPAKPIVKASAGDGYVTLSWDRRAEDSRDPFLGLDPDSMGYKKDFEGYIIYRSTDPGFLDNRDITDAFGNKIFREPVAQFDLKDGLRGTDKVGLPNGAHFYLGDDTGLAHSWTDTSVVNGQIYYYAVVSYDAGDPNLGTGGLPPSQSTSTIEKDAFGNFAADVNTAIVMPGAPSAGYRSPTIEKTVHESGVGDGDVQVHVLLPEDVPATVSYKISFRDSILFNGQYFEHKTVNYSVLDLSNKILKVDRSTYISPGDMYPLFDGLGVDIRENAIRFLPQKSGLVGSSGGLQIEAVADTGSIGQTAGLGGLFDDDYRIEFFDSIVDTSSGAYLGFVQIPVNFKIINQADETAVVFIFIDTDGVGQLSSGDTLIPMKAIPATLSAKGYATTWRIKFIGNDPSPQSGDVYALSFTHPLNSNDVFTFSTLSAAHIEQAAVEKDMERIAVVPNPYIITNKLEPRNLASSGRGERVLTFIHLPQRCTIRIFNLRGYLVQTLEHDSPASDGTQKWNLVSRDGIDVSYGIYLYQIDGHGAGKKVGRFAIIK